MEKLKLLPLAEQEYMKHLFADCTEQIRKNVMAKEVRKGENFITAGEKCSHIFIILRGRAKGIDMQVEGRMHTFKEFGPGSILGEFECLSGITDYNITIQALVPCTCWIIPAPLYLQWMRKDVNALFLRTQRLLYELTWQTKEDRKHYLLNCSDRLVLYFIKQYEKQNTDGMALIKKNRAELADATGFCIKTINRNVKILQEQDYLSVMAGKIHISKEQYEKMQIYRKKKLL